MLLRIVTFYLGLVIAQPLVAAELLMFEDPGCMWCARWNAEIGPDYADSALGRQAPLVRYDLKRDPLPDALELKGRVRYTPTFVLVEDNREVGRIMGYPGKLAFWRLLDDLLGRLDSDDNAAPDLDSANASPSRPEPT